jgi:ATP-binding cassette subfamily C protein CydD
VTVLTGPNGSGKSTALEVILGLTPPSSGRVLIGGVDLATLDPRSWWNEVAWLPSRPVLVPGPVRVNLDLFGPLPDLDAACRATGFDEVLDSLPDGLDTVIGRDGTGLSSANGNGSGHARARLAETVLLWTSRRPTSTPLWSAASCAPSSSARMQVRQSWWSLTARPSSRSGPVVPSEV